MWQHDHGQDDDDSEEEEEDDEKQAALPHLAAGTKKAPPLCGDATIATGGTIESSMSSMCAAFSSSEIQRHDCAPAYVANI